MPSELDKFIAKNKNEEKNLKQRGKGTLLLVDRYPYFAQEEATNKAVVDGMNRRTDLTVVEKGQAGAKLDNKVKAEAGMGELKKEEIGKRGLVVDKRAKVVVGKEEVAWGERLRVTLHTTTK